MKSIVEMSTEELATVLETTDLAVISCASTEPHGPHMPLGADAYQGERAVKDVAQKLTDRGVPAVPGPVVPFGLLTNQFERSRPDPGNVYITADTLKALLIDVTRALMRDGFKRFVWIMSHVENEALMHVAAKQLADEDGAKIVVVNWIQHVNTVYPDVLKGSAVQGHAGEGETSRMLAIRPDLVDLSKAGEYYPSAVSRPAFSGLPYFGGSVGVFHPVEEDRSPGYIGEPHLSNAEDGERMLASLADWMSEVAIAYLASEEEAAGA